MGEIEKYHTIKYHTKPQKFKTKSFLFIFVSHKIKMATVSTKRQRTEKSMKVKYEALKELEKGVPHKDVAARFGVPKNTLSTWKKNKAKIIESYESGLGVWVRPETYEALNKAF